MNIFSWLTCREECEELRSTLTRRHMDEVCLERSDQLRIKAEIDEQHHADEKMYADLWHQDMLAKAAREEREAQARHTRNRETLDTLQKQKAALEAKRLEAKRLKEEEGRLLVGYSCINNHVLYIREATETMPLVFALLLEKIL